MVENNRGRIQRGIDAAVEYSREHKGSVAGGTVLVAGAGAEIIGVAGAVAVPAVALGVLISAVSYPVEWMSNFSQPRIGRTFPEIKPIDLKPNRRVDLTLAASTEEGTTSS